MTTYTADKDALLMELASRTLGHVLSMIPLNEAGYLASADALRAAIKAAQTPAEPKQFDVGNLTFAPNSMPDTHRFGPKSPEPKPSTAYGKLGGCWNIGSTEPKPSAGASVKEPEAIQPWLLDTTVKILKDERYAKQIAEALYGVPVDANAVEVILRAPALLAAKIVEIERISAAKDRDTATPDPNAPQPVNDKAVDAAYRVFQEAGAILLGSILIREALEAAAPFISAGKDKDTATVIADNDAKMKQIADRDAYIDKLKTRITHLETATRRPDMDNDAKMAEIVRLKQELHHERLAAHNLRKIIEGANDLDAAAERARQAWINDKSYSADWRAVARAVYGLTSEGGG